MTPLDGSYHRWLGEDGPQFTLDWLCQAVMRADTELRHTARTLFRPGVFKRPAPTQFSRAMGEIGVQLIFARSAWPWLRGAPTASSTSVCRRRRHRRIGSRPGMCLDTVLKYRGQHGEIPLAHPAVASRRAMPGRWTWTADWPVQHEGVQPLVTRGARWINGHNA